MQVKVNRSKKTVTLTVKEFDLWTLARALNKHFEILRAEADRLPREARMPVAMEAGDILEMRDEILSAIARLRGDSQTA